MIKSIRIILHIHPENCSLIHPPTSCQLLIACICMFQKNKFPFQIFLTFPWTDLANVCNAEIRLHCNFIFHLHVLSAFSFCSLNSFAPNVLGRMKFSFSVFFFLRPICIWLCTCSALTSLFVCHYLLIKC